MRLYHTTPTVNLPSILRRGIDPRCAEGQMVAAWLHTAGKINWARCHVCRRHPDKACVAGVTTLLVNVPRSWLTRRRRGLWTCDRGIDPARISTIETDGVRCPITRFKEVLPDEDLHAHPPGCASRAV